VPAPTLWPLLRCLPPPPIDIREDGPVFIKKVVNYFVLENDGKANAIVKLRMGVIISTIYYACLDLFQYNLGETFITCSSIQIAITVI
jgi:hypothetical protein